MTSYLIGRLIPQKSFNPRALAWVHRYGAPATFHRRGELDRILAAAGLEPVAGATFGFGPFTLLGRRLLPDPVGVRVDASLQSLADRGVPGVRSAGAQYLVVARKPTSAVAG